MPQKPSKAMKAKSQSADEKPILVFRQKSAWAVWLGKNHGQSPGVWLRLARKASGLKSMTHDEALGKVVGIVLTDNGNYDELRASQLAVNDWKEIHLRARINRERLRFSASPDGVTWQTVGPVLDASKLSDDYAQGFTGAMIGLCVQDLGGTRRHADFGYFQLTPQPSI